MNIEQIAEEVSLDFSIPYSTVEFAKAFLARVDQERGKVGAVARVDECDECQFAEILPNCSVRVGDLLYLSPTLPAWQPIETAPKDGTMFLCWVSAERYSTADGVCSSYSHDVSQIEFCWWRNGPVEVPEAGYFDPACGQIGDSQSVTHWMPIPAAPEVPK